MPVHDHTHADHGRGDTPDTSRLSLRQLAHELNSLLDGSLRYVDMARRDLPADASARHDMDCAHAGLVAMARLLERAMQSTLPALVILRSHESIGRTVERIGTLLEPLAAQLDVTLDTRVDAQVANLPAGLLESVLLNTLRNAIEAAAGTGSTPRRVEVAVTSEMPGCVGICVADTGPGFEPDAPGRPGGHGLGLGLCRQIVDELGGRMRVVRAPYDRGTFLLVTVPIASLVEKGEAA